MPARPGISRVVAVGFVLRAIRGKIWRVRQVARMLAVRGDDGGARTYGSSYGPL